MSHEIVQYVAWKPDPYNTATDAMLILWTQGHCYIFPPFCLIPRVISKIHQDQVHTITLITPLWYPQVLGMLTRRQILISTSIRLLVDPKRNSHPLALKKTLMLVAWQASGRDYLSREFLTKQPSLSPSQEGKLLCEITNWPERSGLAGVTHGKFDAL